MQCLLGPNAAWGRREETAKLRIPVQQKLVGREVCVEGTLKESRDETTGPAYPPGAKVKCESLSCVRLFVTPWTVACQSPLSMGFSRQEYWNGLPYSPPGDLPDPGRQILSHQELH